MEQLVETVGLSSLLRYACPDGATEPDYAPKKYMVSRSKYRHDEDHTFTPEWIQYMKQAMQMQNSSGSTSSNATSSSSKENEHQVLEVAVHIRRGDVVRTKPIFIWHTRKKPQALPSLCRYTLIISYTSRGLFFE